MTFYLLIAVYPIISLPSTLLNVRNILYTNIYFPYHPQEYFRILMKPQEPKTLQVLQIIQAISLISRVLKPPVRDTYMPLTYKSDEPKKKKLEPKVQQRHDMIMFIIRRKRKRNKVWEKVRRFVFSFDGSIDQFDEIYAEQTTKGKNR